MRVSSAVKPLEDVLSIAVEALHDACFEGLERVHLVTFSKEQEVLQKAGRRRQLPDGEEYACERAAAGSFGDVEKHEKTCAYERGARQRRDPWRAMSLPPVAPEPDWAKIATAARSGRALEARVRALGRAVSGSYSRFRLDESVEEQFTTRTPYTTKLPPLDTLPARSLSARAAGRPLKEDREAVAVADGVADGGHLLPLPRASA